MQGLSEKAIKNSKGATWLMVVTGIAGLAFLSLRFQMPSVACSVVHSLLFYFSLILLSAGILFLIGFAFQSSKQDFLKAGLLVSSIFFCLIASEIFLRVRGINGTYMENRNGF